MTAYYDTCGANAASSTLAIDKLLAGDFVNANGANAAISKDGGVFHNIVGANAASSANVHDALHHSEAVGANAASSAGCRDRSITRDRGLTAKPATSGAVKDTRVSRDKVGAKAASSGKAQDTLTAYAVANANAASKGGVKDNRGSHDSPGATAASSAGVKDHQKGRDNVNANPASSVAQVDRVARYDHVGAKAASSVRQSDTLVGGDHPGASAAFSCSEITSIAPSLDANLITACRYWCYQSFPEIAGKSTGQRFVEALPPTSGQLRDVDFPCVIIVAGEPTPFSQAVQDVGQHIQVDFVYHIKTFTDNATDTMQWLRGRLSGLRSNLLIDFHLKQANNGYLAQNSEVVADPLQKTTSYQGVFSADNMNVSTAILSMRFTLVTSTQHR